MRYLMAHLEPSDRYKLMTASITPRPIAWVTSASATGRVNAAPYSFFNMMASDPPLVVLGLMRRPDGAFKDTCANIVETGEFVVNLVSVADLEAMNFTSIDAPPGHEELVMGDIATVPSDAVIPPRIASAPVSMECRLFKEIEVSKASTVVLGEVVVFHVGDGFVDPDRLHIDTLGLDLVARMHGRGWYAHKPQMLQRDRPAFADWRTKLRPR